MGTELEAFGYFGRHRMRSVETVRLRPGLRSETLEPVVVLELELGDGLPPRRFALDPDLAEQLAGELARVASDARSRGLDPTGG